MHFRYFTSLFGLVVLQRLASSCKMCDVSIQCSVFDLWLLTASLILFFPVGPSPLTQYAGCHLTRSDPIIFVSWVLLLLYDTGALLIYRTMQSGMCWKVVHSDVDIDGCSSFESLWACSYVDLISRSFLSDNSDRSRGRSRLTELVHRDGQSHLFVLLFIFQLKIL